MYIFLVPFESLVITKTAKRLTVMMPCESVFVFVIEVCFDSVCARSLFTEVTFTEFKMCLHSACGMT